MTLQEANFIVENKLTLEDSFSSPALFVEVDGKMEVNPEFVVFCEEKGYI